MLPSFCIVLPVYNESECIEHCVRNIAGHLRGIDTRTGIVAVDDGSTDDSLEILLRLKNELPDLTVHSHKRNAGYGAANRTAAKIASELGFDYALVMDADGTQAVEFIDRFLGPMQDGVDFIKATRYAKGGRVEGVHWKRVLISRVGNKLAQWLMHVPLTDFTNGFRAIKTAIWVQLATTERNFAMLIEEVYLARRFGVSFAEVPYVLTARQEDSSQSKFTYSLSVYKRYAQYLLKR
jgi:glycosyltransferase involved in cell wall biosynthesis